MRALLAVAISVGVGVPAGAQPATNPHELLKEADRLAWLRAWSKAEPQFTEAHRLFTANGDERNALYAEVSALRARLPRLPVPEVSAQLTEYLERPVVQTDDRLRLRCLVIKGETDEDLDPMLAGAAWKEALAVAEKLGDEAWMNRARGELGLVAFLEGNVGGAVMALGSALKTAQANRDVSSEVRWLTLFGHGYIQLGRPQEALDFYDRALKAASAVPELQFPTMTYVGRSNALIKLGRIPEADEILARATEHAATYEARGYQAQLVAQRAAIAVQQKDVTRALALYEEAVGLARASGGQRLVAEIALEHAAVLRDVGQAAAAERVLIDATTISRDMEERFLLPRLLAATADLRASQGRTREAAALLEEASDLLEGLITTASSPWAQGRVINGMDDVLASRIRLEASRPPDVTRAFDVLQQARARSLLELLVNRPVSAERRPRDVREVERRIASLQRELLQTRDRKERQRLLGEIFAAEEQLAPSTTAMFERARRAKGRPNIGLTDVQASLRADEVLVEYALADQTSLALVVTRSTARVQPLPARAEIRTQVEALLAAVTQDRDLGPVSRRLGAVLLARMPELARKRRLVLSPDGDLHRLPFEVLTTAGNRRLLDTHVVSYVPSASVLALLRRAPANRDSPRRALAVSASPGSPVPFGAAPARPRLARNVYGVDGAMLRQLPGADDEARAVVQLLGEDASTMLVGDAGTEGALKRQPLQAYQVVHFAAHGLPSTKFPARAALLVQPDAVEEPDMLGRAYEYLIEKFADDAGKKGGEFYTPHMVVRLIVELLEPKEGMRICDPTCGSGGMLIQTGTYIVEHGGQPHNFSLFGQEKNLGTWAICKMNMLLHGYPDARIEKGDVIRNPKLLEGGELMLFDRVIANPPFSLDAWGHETAASDAHGRFRFGVPPKTKGDLAFVQHMVASLNAHGKLGVVMPHGVLFRGGSEGEIRRGLLQEDLIEAIVGLPTNLFYGTGIPAAILVINRDKARARRAKVLFVEASRQFGEGSTQNYLRDQDVKKIAAAAHAFNDVDKYARVVDLAEIEKNDWNLNISLYVATAEAEQKADLASALARLRDAERARDEAKTAMDGFLRELGYD